MSDTIPSSYEEAQKYFEQTKNQLLDSNEGMPSANDEEGPSEADYLPEGEKRLAQLSSQRLPQSSKEALEMFDEPASLEHESTRGPVEDDEDYETTDEDRKFYSDFQNNIRDDETARLKSYLDQLNNENAYLKQREAEYQNSLSDYRAKSEAAEQEIDSRREQQILLDLHQAYLDNDAIAHTRLTNELADFKADRHARAVLKAIGSNPYQQNQMNLASSYQQQQNIPQNINGYNVQSYPLDMNVYQNSMNQQRDVASIPPPVVSKRAPAAPSSRVGAPSRQTSRSKEPSLKLNKSDEDMIRGMPWKGSDGKPMSYEDKKKMYIAANYRG